MTAPALLIRPSTPADLPAASERRVTIVGAGIAGAGTARALAERGWHVQVLDAGATPAAGASGLPVGVLAPHTSYDDSGVSRLSRAGLRCMLHTLHNLLTEDDHAWLRSLTTEALDADEVKVLIYARATGAVDNSACRDFSGLDTLAASRVLRRLRDRGLLIKRGGGSSTHYALPAGTDADAATAEAGGQTRLPLEVPAPVGESPYGDSRNPHMPAPESPHGRHVEIPEALRQRIQAAGKKPRQAVVRSLVQALCGLRPFTAAELATLLGGRDAGELKRLHLKPLREVGTLTLLYPESEKHPHQAYLTVPEDQKESSRDA